MTHPLYIHHQPSFAQASPGFKNNIVTGRHDSFMPRFLHRYCRWAQQMVRLFPMKTMKYPEYLFEARSRHLMVWPHQDDEVMYTGLIGRLPEETRFLWVTNGDGLAPEAGVDPKAYSIIRQAEADSVLGVLGRDLSKRHCLAYSEIEIYDRFLDIPATRKRQITALEFFESMFRDIYAHIKAHRPDVLWLPAFQNGHPEHDLVHIMAALAMRLWSKKAGKHPHIYQVPEYEYTILLPMRFHPAYPYTRHEIILTKSEIETKRKAIACYESQLELIGRFERVINGLGRIGNLIGRGFAIDDFLAREQFGPVGCNIDYSRPPHLFESTIYMFERHLDQKIGFAKNIRPIALFLQGLTEDNE